MSGGDDVIVVNQGSTAHVHRFLRILLQDCRLPWVLAELGVTVDVARILDSSVDALSIADAASVELLLLLGCELVRSADRSTTANGTWTAVLRLVECLTLRCGEST